jgi:20S proteasome alpha/beta subunit
VTTCVAVICDHEKAIAIVADRMVGGGVIESPVGRKIFSIHRNWRVLLAGDDSEPAFPVIERATRSLGGSRSPSTAKVARAVSEAYKRERLEEAHSRFIEPRGLTLKQFIDNGKRLLTNAEFVALGSALSEFDFEIELLVAGFDPRGKAHLFTVGRRGLIRWHEAFWAIGSGAPVTDFIMNLRCVQPKLSAREGIYYALEAKYYGELAPGVSEDTDLYLLRFAQRDIEVGEETIDNILVDKICCKVEPQDLKPWHVRLLNELPELQGFPPIERPQKKKSTTQKAKRQKT